MALNHFLMLRILISCFILSLFSSSSFAQTPLNDECWGAALLSTDTVVQGDNFNATSSGLPANCNDFPFFDLDVWYKIETDQPTSLSLLLTAASPDWDGVIKIYSGSCNNLTELDCANFRDDGEFEYIQFLNLDAGNYYIRIYDYQETSSFELTVSEEVCPLGVPGQQCSDGNPGTTNDIVTADCECVGIPTEVNDDICGALELTCGQTYSGNYNLATISQLDDCSGSGKKDLWFTFEADGVSTYFVSEITNDVNVLELYGADDCTGELTPIEECVSLDEYFGDQYPAGTYYVRLRGYFSSNSYTIKLTCAEVPANDSPCTAETFDCSAGNLTGSNFLADFDPVCGGLSDAAAGVWYRFEADFDGLLRLNACQNNSNVTDFEVGISVYQGSCEALDCIGFNDGNFGCSYRPNLILDVLDGQVYYFLISGRDEFSFGNYDIEISCLETPVDCPGLGNIGEPCNDGNDLTFDDTVTEDCTCEGELPQLGRVCEAPLPITTLPFTDADNTANFGDDYNASDRPPLVSGVIVGEGSNTPNFLNGDDVVYAYTPDADNDIDIFVSDEDSAPLGLWVFTGCPFTETLAYATQFDLIDSSSEIFNLPVEAGETYYIVLSTQALFGSFQSVEYTINVAESADDCPGLDGDIGDACDDEDPTTIYDTVNASCECVGEQTSPGDICENPVVISELPFDEFKDAQFVEDFYGNDDIPPLAPNAVTKGGSPLGFLNFAEVVYAYTPAEDVTLDIQLPYVMTSGTSLFVFKGCPFNETVGYDVRNILDGISLLIPAEAGVTYYIVVSGSTGAQLFDIAISECAVDGGELTSSLLSPVVCSGDNVTDLVQLEVEGNQGPNGLFGIVTENNDVVTANQSGQFNLTGLSDGIYKFAHLSYDDDAFVNVDNVSELVGCYDVSNTIAFQKTNLAAGVVSPSGPQQVCGTDGEPSIIDFEVSGNVGPLTVWAVLSQDFSTIIDFGSNPDFNFDDYGPGIYRVVQGSLRSGVNPDNIDPTDLPACIAISNKVVVQVIDCGGLAPGSIISAKPNPTEGLSTVSFTAFDPGNATLEVFDLNGRLVESIFAGAIQPDTEYRFDFDGSALPNGIYIYRLTTETEIINEKFMIAR